MNTSAAIAIFIAIAGLPSAACAQMPDFKPVDLDAMNGRLNEQIAAQQRQIIANILANPQAMAAYRAGVCGAGMTPQQFAYKWAATRGCMPEDTRYYDERRAQQQPAWATRNQQFYDKQYQQGIALGGWKYRYLPNGQAYWYR